MKTVEANLKQKNDCRETLYIGLGKRMDLQRRGEEMVTACSSRICTLRRLTRIDPNALLL